MLVMSHYSALKYVPKCGAWGTWLGKAHHCPSPLIAGDGNHGAPQVFTCPLLGLVPSRWGLGEPWNRRKKGLRTLWN